MSAQHTSGPWVICDDDEFEGCPFIPIETDKPVGLELQIVCEVHGSSPDLDITENDRANARLIAAAPDLLEALERAVQRLEGDWAATKEVALARAAITKARGTVPTLDKGDM